MKVILRDRDISDFLLDIIDHLPACQEVEFSQKHLNELIEYIMDVKENPKKFDKVQPKLLGKIQDALYNDFKEYCQQIKTTVNDRKKRFKNKIENHVDFFITAIGEEKILEKYKTHKSTNFVKGVGISLKQDFQFVRRKNYIDYREDCLFRNMESNEDMLLDKMNNNLPFWFIDTGYTNFINGKKKIWHRLTRNNLHHFKMFEAPVDRLKNFETFPARWRNSGEKILVIEPGSFSAKIFNVNINQWKKDVEVELRKHTDRPIVFREKLSKNIRKNLYQELLDEDYYCVININSNAAIESIWAGIPVITLGTHISNAVTQNKISDINNLYKPNLANWLSILSYSQFTYEELINGSAMEIMREFYE
jgi:hypothetical protein